MTDFTAARVAMVDCQIRPSDVTLYPIIAAMLDVSREEFVPEGYRDVAYAEAAIPLDQWRVVLEPRTFAKMLDALNLDQDALVLDLAPGLGYSSAILSRLSAAVIAVEEDSALASQMRQALNEAGVDTVIVEEGNHAEGAAAHGPYDAILINGGVESIPDTIIEQVKPGGSLIAIVMDGAQGQCRLGTSSEHGVSWRTVFDATAPVLLGFEKEREFVL